MWLIVFKCLVVTLVLECEIVTDTKVQETVIVLKPKQDAGIASKVTVFNLQNTPRFSLEWIMLHVSL